MNLVNETIFDHSPTIGELQDIFAYDQANETICHGCTLVPMALDDYKNGYMVKDLRCFDIALLYFYRGDSKMASKYFAEAPGLYQEFREELFSFSTDTF